jgi:hypothetical protein
MGTHKFGTVYSNENYMVEKQKQAQLFWIANQLKPQKR